MPEQFKPGEVVELKSGGPAMTVESVDGREVWCLWFTNFTVTRDRFVPEVIKLCENLAR